MKEKAKKESKTADIELGLIKEAPWNTHERQRKGDAEFDGLVQSVRESGLIYPIVVSKLKDGTYGIIDGHRRYAACKAAGIKSVPAVVREDMTVEQAKLITATANIQRQENDPLLEAELFESMQKDGMTVKEIAAKIGKEASYVLRRARLTSLSPSWRKLAEKVPFSVEALENIAAHEQPLQEEVWKSLFNDQEPDEDGYDWGELKREFECRMLEIANAKFDTSECANCPLNTGTHGELFAEFQNRGARCQKRECFIKKNDDKVDAEISRLRAKGVEVIEKRDRWSIPNQWGLAEKKNPKRPQPYVFTSAGLRCLMWGEKPVTEEKPAKTKEEKRQEREQKKAEQRAKHVYQTACGKVREALENHRKEAGEVVDRILRRPEFKDWVIEKLFGMENAYLYDYDCMCALMAMGEDVAEKMLGVELDEEEKKIMEERMKG